MNIKYRFDKMSFTTLILLGLLALAGIYIMKKHSELLGVSLFSLAVLLALLPFFSGQNEKD